MHGIFSYCYFLGFHDIIKILDSHNQCWVSRVSCRISPFGGGGELKDFGGGSSLEVGGSG